MPEQHDTDALLGAINEIRVRQEDHLQKNDAQHIAMRSALEELRRDDAVVHAQLNASLSMAAEERDAMRKLLIGNGTPGAMERIRRVENAVAKGERIVVWVICGVLALFGSLVFSALTFFLQQRGT